MQLGIFAKTFPGRAPGPVLAAVAGAGYRVAQFNLACAGLDSMPDAVPPETIEAIRDAAATHRVALAALSGTYNMIHPDPARRADGLARLRVVLDAASRLGIPLVTLCTGTRDPEDQWRHHPDNSRPDAWSDLLREMEQAVAFADAAGVDLGIEPEAANVVSSAADARRLIEAIGSPRVRVVLDPANLFEHATPAVVRAVVAEAVDLLADRIGMAHAKDRGADGQVAAPGLGIVDFGHFIARLREAGFDGPLVTHGLTAEEAPGVARLLSGMLNS